MFGVHTDAAWRLIDEARAGLPQHAAANDVAARMEALLTPRWPADILGFTQPLWDLFVNSCRVDLWVAAYLINRGASNDGFEAFRGWLIAQGHTTYERALASPDSLAGHPAVIEVATTGGDLWGEDMINVVRRAYETVTGNALPDNATTGAHPDLDPL